jgi:hypothetical protein
VIGSLGSLLLFLHWVGSGSSFVKTGAGFRIAPQIVRRRTFEVAAGLHRALVERFITSEDRTPLATREEFPDCGLVVNATVQDRRRPVGTFEDARRYSSAKHHLDYLKSQIITDRQGMDLLVPAGRLGAVHDMQLFREHLTEVEELVAGHDEKPTGILADLDDMAAAESDRVVLVTPHRRPPRGN